MVDDQVQPEDDRDEPVRIDAIAPRTTAKGLRRIPVTHDWVKFSDAYSFMELQIWVDAPSRVMEGLGPKQSDETDDDVRSRVLDTLAQIVLAHRFDDGTPWSDDEGELPPPNDREFWDRIPQPIANAIFAYIRDRTQSHPTLRRSNGTRGR